IIHAIDCGRQLIVSTHTIPLQEQIEKKDLPLCRRLFRSVPDLGGYAGFASTVLVGKSNYLCPSRLSHALAERASLFDDAEYAELQRIADWARATPTGLRHDLQPPPNADVWDSVNADSSACSRRNCDCDRCFYQRARARVRSAQVIVVNHALLFSLISAGGARADGAGHDASGVLFPGDFIVLDEAQTVPEVAEENFGLALSSLGIERTLRHLYNPKTRRGIMKKRGDPEFSPRAPAARGASWSVDALADYVWFCCGRVPGGSLDLFTSYRDMHAVAAAVGPSLSLTGRPFLMQGGDYSRTELAQRMRDAGNAVLFGTDSFWIGVDVPGDALSQVVIARLPFTTPSHPIAEAKAELIRDRGGDPFSELTLPEAVMKFRQGAGRLIRTRTDRGVVTILDSRVLGKSYGRLFMEGLPKRSFVRLTREN